MMIEFRTKNYKSFAEEVKFSMVADQNQSELDYSLLEQSAAGKIIKGLCSSVVYGPNAAGKTNIIGAMEVFRSIVLQGDIRNSEKGASYEAATYILELIPNNTLSSSSPVEFSIKFFENGSLINYSICIDLGLFIAQNHTRRIISEELFVNKELIFSRREEKLNLGKEEIIMDEFLQGMNLKNISSIAENSLHPEELFLINGFKSIFSHPIVKTLIDWFSNKFIVVYRADLMEANRNLKKGVYVQGPISKAVKLFGATSNAVAYIADDDNSRANLCSLIQHPTTKKDVAISAESFESYGTIRFINMFPLIVKALKTGGTLIVDEFDASIHPMALMSIINIFHNNDINVHGAQLIFNTHNPIFLNSNLFRKDEIKFVERDDKTHASTLYALSDFTAAESQNIHKHEDYMKNYFVNRYGAIKDIDFEPIFEEILTKDNGDDYGNKKEN